jgi:hypothetical protein
MAVVHQKNTVCAELISENAPLDQPSITARMAAVCAHKAPDC